MEAMSDWMHDYAVNHEFLKDFMLAWSYYERSIHVQNVKYQVPDLVKITGLLKSVGFNITKVERMEGESWAPGMLNGCTVDIQCPVSKTKITLSAPDAPCNCQKSTDSSWSLSWAGATTGLGNLSSSQMKIAIPPELIPGKAMMVKICMNSLMSIIWPRDGEKFSTLYPMCERLVKSLDCVYQKEQMSGIESARSLQCIGSKGDDSLLTGSNSSLPSITLDSSGVESSTSTPMRNRSTNPTSGKGSKKAAQSHTLTTPKLLSNAPPPNSPYWESSTARAKRYSDSLKQREAEKKKTK